jgi:hypothetical protein
MHPVEVTLSLQTRRSPRHPYLTERLLDASATRCDDEVWSRLRDHEGVTVMYRINAIWTPWHEVWATHLMQRAWIPGASPVVALGLGLLTWYPSVWLVLVALVPTLGVSLVLLLFIHGLSQSSLNDYSMRTRDRKIAACAEYLRELNARTAHEGGVEWCFRWDQIPHSDLPQPFVRKINRRLVARLL